MSDVKELDRQTMEGLGVLYRRYAAWLSGRLAARIGVDAAADVVQETYLRAAPYDPGSIRHPKSFLLRIALNLVRDDHRRRMRGDRYSSRSPRTESEPAVQIDQVLFKQVILTMPPLYRDVFLSSRFGGMTYPEIASELAISVKTVEWRMSKALDHCASRLND